MILELSAMSIPISEQADFIRQIVERRGGERYGEVGQIDKLRCGRDEGFFSFLLYVPNRMLLFFPTSFPLKGEEVGKKFQSKPALFYSSPDVA